MVLWKRLQAYRCCKSARNWCWESARCCTGAGNLRLWPRGWKRFMVAGTVTVGPGQDLSMKCQFYFFKKLCHHDHTWRLDWLGSNVPSSRSICKRRLFSTRTNDCVVVMMMSPGKNMIGSQFLVYPSVCDMLLWVTQSSTSLREKQRCWISVPTIFLNMFLNKLLLSRRYC